MKKNSIKDFTVGDKVCHLSKPSLLMVVEEINPNNNEILCQWIDKDNKMQRCGYKPEVLGKWESKQVKFVTIPTGRKHR